MFFEGADRKLKLFKFNELLGRGSKEKVGSPKMKVFPTMCMKTNSNKFQHFEFETMYMKSKDL